jgi:hypothetical protein
MSAKHGVIQTWFFLKKNVIDLEVGNRTRWVLVGIYLLIDAKIVDLADFS